MATLTTFDMKGVVTTTTTEPYPQNFVPPLLANTWKRYQRGEQPAEVGMDGFPIYADHPLRLELSLLDAFFRETEKLLYTHVKPEKFPSGRAILALDGNGKARMVLAALERLPWFWKTAVKQVKSGLFGKAWQYRDQSWRENAKPLLASLLRTAPSFTEYQFHALIAATCEPPDCELQNFIKPKTLIRLAKEIWPPEAMPQSVVDGFRGLEKTLIKRHWGTSAEERKVLDELAIIGGKPRPQLVESGEAWSNAVLTDLTQMPDQERSRWLCLLEHCSYAAGSKPTKKWLKAADEAIEKIGRQNFKAQIVRWFDLVALPRPVHCEPRSNYLADPDWLICEKNATVLRGLAWGCANWQDAEISTVLANLAEVCFKKIRWLGARCPRVGNACLHSLSTMASEDAAAQLSRLNATVKQFTARKRIGKSLDTAATLTGQTREDLEEKSVPTFGLGMDGKIPRVFGDCSAELRVIHSHDVEIVWSRDGKELKSIPAEVKRDHADALKQFQKLGKDITKMLAAQRIRIERLLMTEREWDFESWRGRYLNQPLLAGISRRLIWHFKLGEGKALGVWLDGKITDVHNQPIDWLAPETRVRLWHPIGFTVETVAAWREWIQAHEICQPFKQAHREVYILTDAELRTHTYSNRFAAHILGQHQFAALCTQRGWKYSFMGGFDSQATPTLELPAWNIRAEFGVEPAGQLADSGVALHLATDQVRFVRNGEPLPLTEVPAPVFTEVMRDVDLFVGVCSIGNDPAWQDRGEIEGAGAYWQNYSFGDLSASAKTRKEILQRLVPKLKIASRCSFDEKFLVVKGSLRVYKIHLGSGNIQMEPNNQYLCIVPHRGEAMKGTDKLFLPFEGDHTLSVILSKAFLLADDAKIKDASIINQIKR